MGPTFNALFAIAKDTAYEGFNMAKDAAYEKCISIKDAASEKFNAGKDIAYQTFDVAKVATDEKLGISSALFVAKLVVDKSKVIFDEEFEEIAKEPYTYMKIFSSYVIGQVPFVIKEAFFSNYIEVGYKIKEYAYEQGWNGVKFFTGMNNLEDARESMEKYQSVIEEDDKGNKVIVERKIPLTIRLRNAAGNATFAPLKWLGSLGVVHGLWCSGATALGFGGDSTGITENIANLGIKGGIVVLDGLWDATKITVPMALSNASKLLFNYLPHTLGFVFGGNMLLGVYKDLKALDKCKDKPERVVCIAYATGKGIVASATAIWVITNY